MTTTTKYILIGSLVIIALVAAGFAAFVLLGGSIEDIGDLMAGTEREDIFYQRRQAIRCGAGACRG